MDSRIQVDFKDRTYTLPEETEVKHPFVPYKSSAAISLHLTLPLIQVSPTTLATIKDLASRADVSNTQKRKHLCWVGQQSAPTLWDKLL